MGNGFVDREDAGMQLAGVMQGFREGNALVLGLPRGGVVVAHTIAHELGLPLGALVVRKLGAPRNPELAIGAVSETGARWLDPHIVREVGASEEYVQREIDRQRSEAARRRAEYCGVDILDALQGVDVIIVDDGIATGATALVAAQSARQLHAASVTISAPVASSHAVSLLRPYADNVIVLETPEPFLAVGLHYGRFDQVGDDEVKRLLNSSGC